MMKINIVKWTLLCLFFLTYSCLENTETDSVLKKAVVEKYDNGNIKELNYFSKSDSIVKEEIFFLNGRLMSESLYEYKNDSIIREHTEYYSNGNRKLWLIALNGTGIHLIEYYENGNKKHEMDELKDKWYFWYRNGQLSVEAHNTNGPIHEYYKSGKKKMSGQFKDMRETGIWEYYDTTGALIQKVEYDSGKLLDKKVYDHTAVNLFLNMDKKK